MPLYFFRIRNGPFSGAGEYGAEFADHEAAWKEMTRVCSDLVGSIARKLKPHSEWQMEFLDESKRPIFRIRLSAEQDAGLTSGGKLRGENEKLPAR